MALVNESGDQAYVTFSCSVGLHVHPVDPEREVNVLTALHLSRSNQND